MNEGMHGTARRSSFHNGKVRGTKLDGAVTSSSTTGTKQIAHVSALARTDTSIPPVTLLPSCGLSPSKMPPTAYFNQPILQ